MYGSPRRLSRLAARPFTIMTDPAALAWPEGSVFRHDHTPLTRRVRAVRRLVAILMWTLIAIPVQAICLLLPGRAWSRFARTYWRTMCWLLGIKVRLAGRSAGANRPVVFVSNHSSWLDVPVLGGQLEVCFVSKDDVAQWPLVSTVAKLGRTVFISRQKAQIGRERDLMLGRLSAGDNLMLFPEGTTSDGSRVLPFRSGFFGVFEDGVKPLAQPVSVVYDRLDGLPTGRASRPLFAWYGDMDMVTHFWRLAQHRGLRATVLLHPALDPVAFADRKALARAVWTRVADGAATLRQNRPPAPLENAEPAGETESGQPALA